MHGARKGVDWPAKKEKVPWFPRFQEDQVSDLTCFLTELEIVSSLGF